MSASRRWFEDIHIPYFLNSIDSPCYLSSVLAMELRLSGTNPPILLSEYCRWYNWISVAYSYFSLKFLI